jgi:hypothetical protein
MVYIQIVLTVMTSFYKPDFLTQTAMALALFYFTFPDYTRRSSFRELNLVIVTSIVFDLIWIIFITDYHQNTEGQDKSEASIRRFSLNCCYGSLIWRVSINLYNLVIVCARAGAMESIAQLCHNF